MNNVIEIIETTINYFFNYAEEVGNCCNHYQPKQLMIDFYESYYKPDYSEMSDWLLRGEDRYGALLLCNLFLQEAQSNSHRLDMELISK